MYKEKIGLDEWFKHGDDFTIDDEDIDDGEISSAQAVVEETNKDLIIKRDPVKEPSLLNEDKSIEFDDESLSAPTQKGIAVRHLREKEWERFPDIKHKDNKSSKKVVEKRSIRKTRMLVGKKRLPLDTNIPLE